MRIGGDDRLADFLDPRRIGHLGRILDLDERAVAQQDLVDDRRRGGDQVHVVFALEPLLHDVHVQQAQEAAAEAEAERLRDLGLVVQRRVVQLQLLQRVAQRLVLVGLHRVQAGEYLRLDLLEAGQRRRRRVRGVGQRVADPGRLELLDAGDDEADVARGELARGRRAFGVNTPTCSQLYAAPVAISRIVPGLERAVHDAHQHHDADVVVEPGVDDQRLQRRVRIALRRRNARDHRLQDVVHALAGLGTGAHRVLRRMPMTSSISSMTRSGSADGRSILFSTGTTSTPSSSAV